MIHRVMFTFYCISHRVVLMCSITMQVVNNFSTVSLRKLLHNHVNKLKGK